MNPLPEEKRLKMARVVELRQEIELRKRDPLMLAYQGLTPPQKSFIHSPAPKRIVEGGNRSGKTWSHIIDRLLQARGLHPVRHWMGAENTKNQEPRTKQTEKQQTANDGETTAPTKGASWISWVGWYGAVSYPLFGLQAWMHYKRLLLYPGESEHRLPTRNIEAIGWNAKNPQIPNYVKIKRADCMKFSEEYIKSFDQGAEAFQSGAPDCLGLDEESPEDVYRECTLRVLDRDANMIFSATPLQGAPYLARLRESSQHEPKRVFHVRLDTTANPSLSPSALAEIKAELGDDEDMIKLRLGGHPLALQGLVYNDIRFRPEHICNVFAIPASWTRYRWIDPGYNNCACLWLAVSPKSERIVAYRDYLGKDKTIEENAANIVRLSSGELYSRTWFDKYYIMKHESVKGERMLDLWRKAGVPGVESVDIGVIPAIQMVWKLLKERAGINGSIPRFQVFRESCRNFINERSRYKWPDAKEKGDDRPAEKPVKRDDHVMDCWKGAVACGLKWLPPPEPAPAPGSDGAMLRDDRRIIRTGVKA